jgi:hypothetical protein
LCSLRPPLATAPEPRFGQKAIEIQAFNANLPSDPRSRQLSGPDQPPHGRTAHAAHICHLGEREQPAGRISAVCVHTATVALFCDDFKKCGNFTEMLPLWRTPHTFGLLPVEGDDPPLPPIAAVTVGPLAADLAALAHPTHDTVVRVGRTLGFEWLASLAAIDRTDGLDQPALTTFLQERYALTPGVEPNPFGTRSGSLVRQHPRPIPDQVLAEFATREAGRLEYIGNTIQSLATPLLATAQGKTRPAARQRQRAAELLNALHTPIQLQRFKDTKTKQSIYGLVPRNLYARALLELIELYDDTPPLAICARCTRLFVRRRNNDKYCNRYIWPAQGGENIADCVFDKNPTPTRTRLESKAHRRHDKEARRRAYKKLQMRAIRAANELGPKHPETIEAEKAFEQWKEEHKVTLGRPMTPMPLNLRPDRKRA